jgi:hypothetical protein
MPINDGEPPDSGIVKQAPVSEDATGDQAMCFCPVCSRRLLSHRCKLICEQCGYFMSCADYY